MGQLALVHEPVAQGGSVVVPMAEPAVVQHKGIDAHPPAALYQFQQLFLVELEIGGLPVVDDDGPGLVADFGVPQVVFDGLMEVPGQASKAAVRVGEDGLGGGEGLPVLQPPGEVGRMDPYLHPGLSEGRDLRLGQEVAAVNQRRAVALARCLGGLGRGEGQEGVMLMAGRAPAALHSVDPAAQRGAIDLPLPAMDAVQADHVPSAVWQIHAGTEHAGQIHRRAGGVDHPDVAGNHVAGGYTHSGAPPSGR